MTIGITSLQSDHEHSTRNTWSSLNFKVCHCGLYTINSISDSNFYFLSIFVCLRGLSSMCQSHGNEFRKASAGNPHFHAFSAHELNTNLLHVRGACWRNERAQQPVFGSTWRSTVSEWIKFCFPYASPFCFTETQTLFGSSGPAEKTRLSEAEKCEQDPQVDRCGRVRLSKTEQTLTFCVTVV